MTKKELQYEIERLRKMIERRDEFIARHNLWAEFGKWLSEPNG